MNLVLLVLQTQFYRRFECVLVQRRAAMVFTAELLCWLNSLAVVNHVPKAHTHCVLAFDHRVEMIMNFRQHGVFGQLAQASRLL